jgi:hypothetical protein
MNPNQKKIIEALKKKGLSEVEILSALTYVAQSIMERTIMLAAEDLSEADLKTFTELLEKGGEHPEELTKFVESKIPDFDKKSKALADDIMQDYLLVAEMK